MIIGEGGHKQKDFCNMARSSHTCYLPGFYMLLIQMLTIASRNEHGLRRFGLSIQIPTFKKAETSQDGVKGFLLLS